MFFFSSPHGTRRDLDFERERYVKIDTAENCMYWAFVEVFDHDTSDDYFGIIDGYLVLIDEKHRFFLFRVVNT